MSDNPEEPQAMGKEAPDPKAFADRAVLGLCDFLALLFGLPFGEALYNDRPITGWDKDTVLGTGERIKIAFERRD
jgi:hypothetical protein